MGKAPAVQTADAFFEVLQKSRLLSEEQLAEVKESTAGQDDARGIARFLLKQNLLTRWQANQLLAGYHALTVGKYKLCDALGRGELGRVFLAQHGQLGRQVALKVLPRQHTQQARVLERFLAEARKIADLDHRNVIHIFDIDDEDGRYFLVTEYAAGSDLKALVEEKGPLPPAEAGEIARQAAEGLAFLHEREIAHQDLKPANIVRNNDGVVKLLDVGVGRLRDAVLGEQVSSSAETEVGPRYLAPEQLGGQAADARSDLFSLGCVLYWMLAGSHPYPRATSAFGSAPPLSDVRPDAPEPLTKLCQDLMQLKPADRTITASQAAQRLNEYCQANPLAATNGSGDSGPVADTQKIDADTKTLEAGLAGLADAADSGPVDGAIAISTKKRKKSGAKKAANKAPAKTVATDAGAGGGNKKMLLILGAGVAAVAMVIAIIAFLFMGGGNGPAVAANDNEAEAEVASGETAGDDADLGDPEIGDPEIGDPEIGDPEIGDPEVGNPAPGAAGNGTQQVAANAAANDAANNNGAATADVADPPNNAAAAAPNETQPNETKPEPDATAKPPTPKPDPPKERAKPAVAKATEAKDPLAKVPAIVELPPLFDDEGEPHPQAQQRKPLGTIVLADKVLCSIYMRGGDGATRGRKVFTIRNANGGLAEREWEIRLEGSDIGGENIVARLKLEDDHKLYFQWSEEAVQDEASAHLINCMLNVNLTVGGATKDVALRRPVIVEPITLDMERTGTKVRWEIPTPPDPNKVYLQITNRPPPFPKSTVEPDKPVNMDRATQMIRVGEKEENQVLVLKVDSDMKRNVEVNVTAWAQFNKAAKPERINKASLKKMEMAAQTAAQAAGIKVAQLAALKPPGNDRQKKQQLDQAKNLADQQLKYWTEVNGKMETLKQLYEQLNGNAKINFRVYYQTEAGEITLLRTK